MSRLVSALEQLPAPVQISANWSSIGAAMSAFVGLVQGPLAVIASGLSIIWIGLQIYSWVERRRRPSGKRRKGDQ